ncbi:MAG: hypothetical protein R6W81_14115, partial [Bacteroidales bacterium]
MTSENGHISDGSASGGGTVTAKSFRRLLLVAGCLLLVNGYLTGQTLDDFRTTGNATFNSPANWERYNGTAWVPAGAEPTVAAYTITIRNTHTVAVTVSTTLNQLVVEAGGILTINAGITLTLFIGPGTDLDVSGTVNNSGSLSINAGATIVFNANSTYNHTRNGGTIPTATWNPASNCNITGITNSNALTGFNQVFGNFTWNCPGQTINFYMESDITIAGNLTVSATGAFDPNLRALRMSNSATGYTMTVNGNVVIQNNATFKMNNGSGSCTVNVGGDLMINSGNFTIVTGAASSLVSVAGNVSILGGTLLMHEDNSSTIGTLDLKGNFTLSGTGTINEANSGSGLIVFSNTSTNQTIYRSGGTITNTINFTVNPDVTVVFGQADFLNGGGRFTLSNGATMRTAHPSGINGSVQTTLRTLSASANYTFNGTSV